MSFQVTLVRCFDGDTLDVQNIQGHIKRLRLWGIDAPEKGQIGFRGAKQYLEGVLSASPFYFVPRGRDKYERVLASVRTADGRDVSEDILACGWAWWYRQYCPMELRLGVIEKTARDARLGIWAEDAPIPPWAWRRGKRCGRVLHRGSVKKK